MLGFPAEGRLAPAIYARMRWQGFLGRITSGGSR